MIHILAAENAPPASSISTSRVPILRLAPPIFYLIAGILIASSAIADLGAGKVKALPYILKPSASIFWFKVTLPQTIAAEAHLLSAVSLGTSGFSLKIFSSAHTFAHQHVRKLPR
jgi:surface polysaccharide O-acyltransferase-like enzyme